MALTQVPPALLTSTTGTGSTVALSASPTFTGTVTTPSVTFSDASTQTAAASPYVLKNRIINGDMRIDQRNAGASVTVNSTTAVYPVDRFPCLATDSTGVFTEQQVSDAPVGFVNSIKATVTTSYSPSGSNQYNIRHNIEGYNIADLGWGTANAKTVTLSFWVKSSITGTFGGSLANSAFDRSYPFSYTISVANTWEQKSITIAGDTTGTWLTTNGIGIRLIFSIGMGSTLITTAGAWAAGAYLSSTGSTNLIATNGATFYITGVQLEQNTSATPFERRLYNQELANCQRYCPMIGPVVADSFSAVGYTLSTTQGRVVFQFPVTARTAPTGITVTNPTGFALAPPFARAASAIAFSESNTQYASVDVTVTGLTANQPTTLRIGSSGGCKIEFTGCEL